MLRIFIFFFVVLTLPLYASKFPNIVIFGDSLSDEGRLYAATRNTFPPQPFFDGRFCNGSLWVEYMDVIRQNYAFAGAKSDHSNMLEPKLGEIVANTGLQSQVNEYLATQPLPEDMAQTQYYISIGANDFLAVIEGGDTDVERLIPNTVDNIIDAAERLRAAGATHVMLMGLPNLGRIPLAKDSSFQQKQVLGMITMKFNLLLESQASHHRLEYFDMFGSVNKIMQNASFYGLTNVEDACFDEEAGIVCDNPAEYFFWDSKHPTTRVHQIFAGELE